MPSKWMAFLFGIWAPQRTRGSIASILPSTDGRDATHRSFWRSQKKMRRDTEAAQLPEYSRICRAEHGNENFICRIRTSVVHRLPKPRRRVRLPYPAPKRNAIQMDGISFGNMGIAAFGAAKRKCAGTRRRPCRRSTPVRPIYLLIYNVLTTQKEAPSKRMAFLFGIRLPQRPPAGHVFLIDILPKVW